MIGSHIQSSRSSKTAISIVIALLATGFSVSPIFFLARPSIQSPATSSQQITFGDWNDIQPAYSDSGTIAYSSDRTGSYQIFTMDSSGSHETQRTAISTGDALYPEFSPLGNLLSYLWTHDGYTDLCFVTIFQYPDFPSSSCATSYAHVGIHYSWSANGQIIAYDTGSHINLYYVNENRTVAFPFNGTAYEPEFCGASALCFTGSTNHPNETAIWISTIDGTNLTRLSWTGRDFLPEYSPAVRMVLYLANYTGSPEAWVVGTNGTLDNVLFQIIPSTSTYYPPPDLPKISMSSPPEWNPVADQVLVTGMMSDKASHFVVANVTSVPMIANGVIYSVTAFSVIKFIPSFPIQAMWNPNGKDIIYVSNSSGFEKIYLLILGSTSLTPAYGS
ncbi:MAG: PD40 domain-containing protein [Nitrososphaerota archaeon]|nr:PD40 domain-containing protein [Nitrososphaerota archaeon]